MKCARCHREVEHPVKLAGMHMGKACAARVREAVLQPLQAEQQHTEPDPRQTDLFLLPDLLGDAPMDVFDTRALLRATLP